MESRKNPYYRYAIDALPKHSRIENAVAAYLGKRLSQSPTLHPKIWEACIDELVAGLHLSPAEKVSTRRIGYSNPKERIDDIVYLFEVATARGWHHVYFTQEHDRHWNNISYRQDPYWSEAVEIYKDELEVILNGRAD